MTPGAPRAAQLREHPELAILVALDHQLVIAVEALAARHRDAADSPLLHQARAIAHVARVLGHQLDAYRELVASPTTASSPSKDKRP